MKRRILTFLLAASAVLSLSMGLAACGGTEDDHGKADFNVTVGESVKKLVGAPLKGVSGIIGWRNTTVEGSYTDGEFDYMCRTNQPTHFSKVYYRGGKWFAQNELGSVGPDTQWEDVEFSPLDYGTSLDEFYRPDARAAAYGYAMMLSVKENSIAYYNAKMQEIYANQPDFNMSSVLRELPEDGVWTGEVDFEDYTSWENFYDDEWAGEIDSAVDVVEKMPFFRFATAPFTQDQFKELLTALSSLDTPLATLCGSIVREGKTSAGQSAYDYLMDAFGKIFQGVNGGTYDESAVFPGLVRESDEMTGFLGEFCTAMQMIWAELPMEVLALTVGKDSYVYGIEEFTAIFDEQGGLTRVTNYSNRGSFGEAVVDDILFTDTPAVEDIDDVVMTHVELGYAQEHVTCLEYSFLSSEATTMIEVSVSLTLDGGKIAAIESVAPLNSPVFTFGALGEYSSPNEIGTRYAPVPFTVDGRSAEGRLCYNDTAEGNHRVYWSIEIPADIFQALFERELTDEEKAGYVKLVDGTLEPDHAVCYRATVSEFAQKSLAELPHVETLSYTAFQSALAGSSPSYDYYVDGEKIANIQYFYYTHETQPRWSRAVYYRTLFNEPWSEMSYIYFHAETEEEGLYAYKTTSRAGWRESGMPSFYMLKIERPGILIDPVHNMLRSMEKNAYYAGISLKDGALEYEVDGVPVRMDLADCSFSFEVDGVTVTARLSDWSYSSEPSWFQAERITNVDAPAEDALRQALEKCLSPDSVTVEKNGRSVYELDLAHRTAYTGNTYYKIEEGVLKEYYTMDGNTWESRVSSRTEEEIFDYPLKALVGVPYEDFVFDVFDRMFYVTVNGTLYGIHLSSDASTVDFLNVSTDDVWGDSYRFSGFGSTTVRLPQSELNAAGIEKALQDSLDAKSYEMKITIDANDLVLNESIDFTNRIAHAVLTNKKGESPLNVVRAVTEGKTWVYSDASGAWLRTETGGDTATYIASFGELTAIKAAWDELTKAPSYTIPWDRATDAYTIGEYTVTFADGRVASYRHGEGVVIVATFSKYNEISLTLPSLGTDDDTVREKFITAMRNTVSAENFHAEWTLNDMTYSSDIVAGQRAFTRVSSTVQGLTIPFVEMYREKNGDSVDLWQREIDFDHSPSPDQIVWGEWSGKTSMPEDAQTLRQDLFLQNCAYAAIEERDPGLFYIFAKYDAAADTYTIRDFNVAHMSVIECTIKFENGYVKEWTTKNRDWLKDLGVTGDSLKIAYSHYGETTVQKPTITT